MGKTKRPRRAPGHDYASPGEYFVTFCTHERSCTLGSISPEGEFMPSEYGSLCSEHAKKMSTLHPGCLMDAFVVMPNHVHTLMRITPETEGAQLSRMVAWWKEKTAKAARRRGHAGALWQRSFHDHIVRDEADRSRLLEYIQNNPKRWQLDSLYRTERP